MGRPWKDPELWNSPEPRGMIPSSQHDPASEDSTDSHGVMNSSTPLWGVEPYGRQPELNGTSPGLHSQERLLKKSPMERKRLECTSLLSLPDLISEVSRNGMCKRLKKTRNEYTAVSQSLSGLGTTSNPIALSLGSNYCNEMILTVEDLVFTFSPPCGGSNSRLGKAQQSDDFSLIPNSSPVQVTRVGGVDSIIGSVFPTLVILITSGIVAQGDDAKFCLPLLLIGTLSLLQPVNGLLTVLKTGGNAIATIAKKTIPVVKATKTAVKAGKGLTAVGRGAKGSKIDSPSNAIPMPTTRDMKSIAHEKSGINIEVAQSMISHKQGDEVKATEKERLGNLTKVISRLKKSNQKYQITLDELYDRVEESEDFYGRSDLPSIHLDGLPVGVSDLFYSLWMLHSYPTCGQERESILMEMSFLIFRESIPNKYKSDGMIDMSYMKRGGHIRKDIFDAALLTGKFIPVTKILTPKDLSRIEAGKTFPRTYSIGETLRLSPLTNWKNDSRIAVPDLEKRLKGKCSSFENFKIRSKRSPVGVRSQTLNPPRYRHTGVTGYDPRPGSGSLHRTQSLSFGSKVQRWFKRPLSEVRNWSITKRLQVRPDIDPYLAHPEWIYYGHLERSNPGHRVRSGLFLNQDMLRQNNVMPNEIPHLDNHGNTYQVYKAEGAGPYSQALGVTTRPLRSEAKNLVPGSTEYFNSNRKVAFANGKASSYGLIDLSENAIPTRVGRIGYCENPHRPKGGIPFNDRYSTLTREQRRNVHQNEQGYVLKSGERVDAPLNPDPEEARLELLSREPETFRERSIEPINIGQLSLRAASTTRNDVTLNPQQGVRADNTYLKSTYVKSLMPNPRDHQANIAKRITGAKLNYVNRKAGAYSAKQEFERLTDSTTFRSPLDAMSEQQAESFARSFKTEDQFPKFEGQRLEYTKTWSPKMSADTGAIPKRTRPSVKPPTDDQIADEMSRMGMHYESLARTDKASRFSKKLSNVIDKRLRSDEPDYEIPRPLIHGNLNIKNRGKVDVPVQNLYPNSQAEGSLMNNLFSRKVKDASSSLQGYHKPRPADLLEKQAKATKTPRTYEPGHLESKAVKAGVLYDSSRGPRINQKKSNSLIMDMSPEEVEHIYEQIDTLNNRDPRFILRRDSQIAKEQSQGITRQPASNEIPIPKELNGKKWHNPVTRFFRGRFSISDQMKHEAQQVMNVDSTPDTPGQPARQYTTLTGDQSHIANPNDQNTQGFRSVMKMQWWGIILTGGGIAAGLPFGVHAMIKGEEHSAASRTAAEEDKTKYLVKQMVDAIEAKHQLDVMDYLAIADQENREELLLQARNANELEMLKLFKDSPSFPDGLKNRFEHMDYETFESLSREQGEQNDREVENYRAMLQNAVDESQEETKAQLLAFSRTLNHGIPRGNLTYHPGGNNGVFAQELHKDVYASRPDPIAQGLHPHLPEIDRRFHEDWLRAKGNTVLHREDPKYGTTLAHSTPYNGVENQLWRAGAKKAKQDENVLREGAKIMRKYIADPRYHAILDDGSTIPAFDMEGSNFYKDITSQEIAALIRANQVISRWSGGDDEAGRLQLTLTDISMKTGSPVKDLVDGALPPLTYNWPGERAPEIAVMPRHNKVKGLGIVDEDQPGSISSHYDKDNLGSPNSNRLGPVGSRTENLQDKEFFTVVVDQSTLPISSVIPLQIQSDAYGNYWLPYVSQRTEFPEIGTITGPQNQIQKVIKVPGPRGLVDQWAIAPPYGHKIRLYEPRIHGPITYSPPGSVAIIDSALSPSMILPSSMEWNNWSVDENGVEEEVITGRIEGLGLGEESMSAPSQPIDIPSGGERNRESEEIEMQDLNHPAPQDQGLDDVSLSDTSDSDQFHLSLGSDVLNSSPPGPPDDPPDPPDSGGYEADNSDEDDEEGDRRITLHHHATGNNQLAPYIAAAIELARYQRNSIVSYFVSHPNVYSSMTFSIGAFLASAATAAAGQLANHLRVNLLRGIDELVIQLVNSGKEESQRFLNEITDLGWDMFRTSGLFDSKDQMKNQFSRAGSLLMKDVEKRYEQQNIADELKSKEDSHEGRFDLEALNSKEGREKALRFWQFIKSDKSLLSSTARRDDLRLDIEQEAPELSKVLYKTRSKREISPLDIGIEDYENYDYDYDDYEETSGESDILTDEQPKEVNKVTKENKDLEGEIRKMATQELMENNDGSDLVKGLEDGELEKVLEPTIDPKYFDKPWKPEMVMKGLISESFLKGIMSNQRKRLATSKAYANRAKLQRELAEKSRISFLKRMGAELSGNGKIKGILTSSRDADQSKRIYNLEQDVHKLKLKDIETSLKMKMEKKNKLAIYDKTMNNMSILSERNAELRRRLEVDESVLAQHQGYLNLLRSNMEMNKAKVVELRSLLLRRSQQNPVSYPTPAPRYQNALKSVTPSD